MKVQTPTAVQRLSADPGTATPDDDEPLNGPAIECRPSNAAANQELATEASFRCLPAERRPRMHGEVEWYVRQWHAWTTNEQVRKHPRFHPSVQHYEQSEPWLRPRHDKSHPYHDESSKSAVDSAEVEAHVCQLPVEPSQQLILRLRADATSLQEKLQQNFEKLGAVEPGETLWEHCKSLLPARIDTLNQAVNKLTQGQTTYEALLAVIPAYLVLADAEFFTNQLLAGKLNREHYTRAEHIFGSMLKVKNELENVVLASAPARLMYPTFAKLDYEDIPALPVWPIALARGPQSYDGKSNVSPSQFALHDMFHAKYLTRSKIRARGGRKFAGTDLTSPVERRELEVLVRTAHREEALRLFWLKKLRTIADPRTRTMIRLAVFAVVHETEEASAPTRQNLIAAVKRLQAAVAGASLTSGTDITPQNIDEVARNATEWLTCVKFDKRTKEAKT